MSKNITIQEGGVAKQLTVDKLKTNLVSSGTCLWVPEDEVQLTTKTITENGTYKASDDGYYGYSEVTVNGVGTTTGKDGDGDDAIVTVDDDGQLVLTKLVKSIAIVTYPTLLTYSDGDTINFSGLSVHGYSTTGQDLGDITNDCVFPVTTADYSQGTETGEYIVPGLNSPVYLTPVHQGDYIEPDDPYGDYNLAHYISSMTGHADAFVMYINDAGVWELVYVSDEYFTFTHQRQCPPAWSPQIRTERGQEYTYAGYTGYVTTASRGTGECKFPISAQQDMTVRDAAIFAYMNGTPVPGRQQSIPIQYTDPNSGEEFEVSFTIQVTQGA